MNDVLYPTLKKRLDEVYGLAPNDLHHPVLTKSYKMLTGKLKTFPFKIILPLSFFATVAAYVVLGFLLIRLVSVLQFGF